MTLKLPALLALSLAAAIPALPAHAQAQPSDAKCLLLSNLYAKQADDEKARNTAEQASFFYLGRVTGPAAQIQARIAEEARTLSAETNGPAMAACVNAMVTRAGEVRTVAEPKPGAVEGR